MTTTSVGSINNGKAKTASTESQRPVFVLFTSQGRTLKALQHAGELAEQIGGRVVIVAIQVVPFPLPLEDASAPMEFMVKRFAETVENIYPNVSIAAYLCRDRLEALKKVIAHDSPILIGARKRWWKTHDEKLADTLRGAGFAVLRVDAE